MFLKTVYVQLALAATGLAKWTNNCRNWCLWNNNILVSECSANDGHDWVWQELDLNYFITLVGAQLQYQQEGYFSIDGQPCYNCYMEHKDAIVRCICKYADITLPAGLDLDEHIHAQTGQLCFENEAFGPICSRDTKLSSYCGSTLDQGSHKE